MKKIIALLLALIMVLAMGVVALAEGEDAESDEETTAEYVDPYPYVEGGINDPNKKFAWEDGMVVGPFGFSPADRYDVQEGVDMFSYTKPDLDKDGNPKLDDDGNPKVVYPFLESDNKTLMWYFGSWGHNTNAEFDPEVGHTEKGSYKLPNGYGYRAFYIWTKIYDAGRYEFSAWIKGTKGETVWFDLEGNGGVDIWPYTFQSDDWEQISWEVWPLVGRDPAGNSYPLRIYVNGKPDMGDFWIDDISLKCLETEKEELPEDDEPLEYSKKNTRQYNTFQGGKVWDWGCWGDGSTHDKEVGHLNDGSIKLATGQSYRAFYVWTHIKDIGDKCVVSFWAKGKAGDTISLDTEANLGCDMASYTFQSDDWEKVEYIIDPIVEAADPNTGGCFRVYSTDANVADFWVDEVVINTFVSEETTAAADDTTAAPADDTTAAPADDTTDEPTKNDSKIGLIIGIVAAVVVVAAVLAIVLGKKKK